LFNSTGTITPFCVRHQYFSLIIEAAPFTTSPPDFSSRDPTLALPWLHPTAPSPFILPSVTSSQTIFVGSAYLARAPSNLTIPHRYRGVCLRLSSHSCRLSPKCTTSFYRCVSACGCRAPFRGREFLTLCTVGAKTTQTGLRATRHFQLKLQTRTSKQGEPDSQTYNFRSTVAVPGSMYYQLSLYLAPHLNATGCALLHLATYESSLNTRKSPDLCHTICC
jgi:hypothetical protein